MTNPSTQSQGHLWHLPPIQCLVSYSRICFPHFALHAHHAYKCCIARRLGFVSSLSLLGPTAAYSSPATWLLIIPSRSPWGLHVLASCWNPEMQFSLSLMLLLHLGFQVSQEVVLGRQRRAQQLPFHPTPFTLCWAWHHLSLKAMGVMSQQYQAFGKFWSPLHYNGPTHTAHSHSI